MDTRWSVVGNEAVRRADWLAGPCLQAMTKQAKSIATEQPLRTMPSDAWTQLPPQDQSRSTNPSPALVIDLPRCGGVPYGLQISRQCLADRQHQDDYIAVSVDPENDNNFWVIGEFAREYNNAAGGHPGGTGFARWGTYIAELEYVPEPPAWTMIILALGIAGFAKRRRRSPVAAA